MSTIDLERLIVRQTYFVPHGENKLRDAILTELNKHNLPFLDIEPWFVASEHKGCFSFERSMHWIHIDIHSSTGASRKEIRELDKQYLKMDLQGQLEDLEIFVDNVPFILHVRVVRSEKTGCEVEVECLPSLYTKLNRLRKVRTDEFTIQDAVLTCRRFLKHIFESGLSSTLIKEEKREPLKPTVQLLINDQASRQILLKIEEMLEQATGEVLLCGWIGTLLLPKLKEINQKGVNIRVITHKKDELKGQPGKQDVQRAFQELISMIGEDNISIRPECHCRVVVVDNKALIGSMDINAISLTGSHRELAIYTEDPEIVRNLRKYFNEIFSPLSKEKAK